MKAKVFNISTFTEKYQFAKKIDTYFVRMGGAGVGPPTFKMGDMFSYAFDSKYADLSRRTDL